jgi:uncharacterized membrane protein YraQ (UPF0718 family)
MTLEELYNLLFGSYNPVQKGLVILALIAFIALFMKNPIKGREATQSSFETFANVLLLIFAGTALGSVIQAVVPREVIARTLGKGSGLLGILLATGLGGLLPGGPYVVYPVLASLYAAGADIGPIIAFIVAWSTIALGRVPFELAFFNPKIVATRILVGIPLPIIAGYLTKMVSSLIS